MRSRKKTLFFIFALTALSLLKGYGKGSDTTKFLLIKLNLAKGEILLQDYRVIVYDGNDTTTSFLSTSSYSKIWLAVNKKYTIEIIKYGYVKRIISINTDWTHPSKSLRDDKVSYTHNVEINMETDKGQESFFRDFPIGMIEYDFKTDEFIANIKYRQQVKKEMQKEKAIALKKAAKKSK